uniref:DUF1761 domain-containing protein n=1 Tax=Compsopogon caeruleus TaxID=31354 RepID=A0A7S1T4B1_9RHOD|mmetsp:Transcript_10129/g.20470  ORF Transcript_10129/g.20470 Transcript_10129/m.20470 type:complete len:131 (+) Transcript_10129:168-560(+)
MRFVSVFLACVMHCLLGFIWYGPLYGSAFLRLAHPHKVPNDTEPDPKAFVSMGVGTLVGMGFYAFVLDIVAPARGVDGMLWGVLFGFLDAGMHMPHGWFEERPFGLYLLHQGYHWVSYIINGALIAWMNS